MSWAGLTCMGSELQVLHVVEAGNTLFTLLVAALAVVQQVRWATYSGE